MMKLALKVDAATFRGTLVGVTRLIDALSKAEAQATFFFNLGPDRSGRLLGSLLAASRKDASALSRYGMAGLLQGTLLPGPDVGRRCADILREVRDAGFDTGVQGWDHAAWQRGAEKAGAAWTERQMQRAIARFGKIFGEAPKIHAAADWQMNPHALRLTERLGFGYASDTRGTHPFIPVWNAEVVLCPQLPTTLPTLDELLGRDGCNIGDAHERLLALTAEAPATGHVYTVQANLEGQGLLPVFVKLLEGWKKQGYELVSLGGLLEAIDASRLPRHELVRGRIEGRAGTHMLQGPEFLAEA